jgi:hypothetical protein
MSKKPSKPFRMAPLQKLAVKPTEDPAEQAVLDKRLKRSAEAASPVGAEGRVSSKATPLAVLERCRQLSATGRLLVAIELMDQLSVDQRMELVERLAAQLPPEAIRRVEERLHRRAGGAGDDGNGKDSKKQE